jgi:hypothetical protein
MGDSKQNIRYRVVGIRINGQRVSLGHDLDSEEARRIRGAIAEANIFAEIQIELDTDHDDEP